MDEIEDEVEEDQRPDQELEQRRGHQTANNDHGHRMEDLLAGLIRRLLAFTVELLGDDPWKRKW